MSEEIALEGESADRSEIIDRAGKLLEDWINLKEEFRIPRKQRVKQMKEHERQAGNFDYII